MNRNAKLERLYNKLCYLTLHHDDFGEQATVTAKDLGDALERIDPEWFKLKRGEGGYVVGEPVKIKISIGDEFKDDRIGEIVSIDGSYIMVELAKSKVETECYPCEIERLDK